MRIVVTGAAGFIGYHLTETLLLAGHEVLGIDGLNTYYDPALKRARLERLNGRPGFRFVKVDIAEADTLGAALEGFAADVLVHLAAQAGVRYSIDNPGAYGFSNLIGHLNILEVVRRSASIRHLVYASSSSVYGDREDGPFRESDRCDHPASLYAATKRSCELMSGAYARLYGLRQTGLRFFTVYGPWGRPDMAYWLFSEAILKGEPIRLFNEGKLKRDFTDVRDVVACLTRIVEDRAGTGHEIFNIGNSQPVELSRFVAAIEAALGVTAKVELAPMQKGDVSATFADTSKLEAAYGYKPSISIEEGMAHFAEWFRRWNARGA
jgi:UDP-glucuronate 4-epimerase